MTARLEALRAAPSSYNFWGNKHPKCPHCGRDFVIEDNDAYELYEEGSHEVECGGCEFKFTVTSRATWSFDTDTQDDDEEAP
jgi:hypothetical protein